MSPEAAKQEAHAGQEAELSRRLIAPLLLLVAGFAVYFNSFSGEFVFDDIPEIRDNPSMQVLWPPNTPMFKANELPTRPVPYYTFALNRVLLGEKTFGFHLVNLAIHLTNALLAFEIIRLTVDWEHHPRRLRRWSTEIAFGATLLWVVHPLNTEAITYIYQRMESLMSLFFLLTFYCFLRANLAHKGSRRVAWYGLSVVAAAFGMGCKEVMVVVPVVIAWYDFAFVNQSIRKVIATHWKYYLALCCTWPVLFGSMFVQIEKYGVAKHSSWQHAISEPHAIVYYLRQAAFPSGQCFDLGWKPLTNIQDAMPSIAVVLSIVALVGYLVIKEARVSFFGGFFLLVLAPTSSIVPVADIADEYRMYLPLLALTTAICVAMVFLLSRISSLSPTHVRMGLLIPVLIASIWFATKTIQRNKLYQSRIAIWLDAVNHAPDNVRAHYNLTRASLDEDNFELAVKHGTIAVTLAPGDPKNQNNLGLALYRTGKLGEAVDHYKQAIQLDQEYANAYLNLGNAMRHSSIDDAVRLYQKAIELKPDYSEAYNNLGLVRVGAAPEEALALFRKALELNPRNANAHCSLGNALARAGKLNQAIVCYRRALEIDPDLEQASANLAVVTKMKLGN